MKAIFFFVLFSFPLLSPAQDKWSHLILRLDSLEEFGPAYAQTIVEITWQISDLSPDTAIYYGNLGLRLAEEQNNDSLRCRSLLGLSAAISRQSKHAESIEMSLEALRLAESIGDTVSMYDAATNIGIDMYYQEDLENSLKYFKRSVRYLENYRPDTYKSKHQYANALMNVALTEADLGKTENEIKTYYKVAGLFLDIGDNRNYGLVLFNLGKAYGRLDQNDSTTKYFESSLKIFQDSKWTSAESDVLTSWSKRLFEQQQYRPALALTHRSLAISTASKNTLQLQFAFELLQEIYAAMDLFDSAYYYQEKYLTLFKESRETEKQEYADELLAKYETEKKEQQIAQLESDNLIQSLQSEKDKQTRLLLVITAIALVIIVGLLYVRSKSKSKTNALLDAKNQELAKLNQTKDRLFSIISHDLKSPLSSFHTITKSLSDNWEMLEKEQLKEFIITLRDSSSDVKDMMDNLLKWALSQSNQLHYKPTKVAPKAVVTKVISELGAVTSLKNIPIQLTATSSTEITADHDFLQIVVRNLLSNALKFSKNDSKIEVTIEEESDHQILSIQDYGVGMDQAQADQLFAGSIVAQDIQNSTEKGTGLGLVLCKELMEKMKGRIEVRSELGKGTIFRLVFSKAA